LQNVRRVFNICTIAFLKFLIDLILCIYAYYTSNFEIT